jgi:hypothetical protein
MKRTSIRAGLYSYVIGLYTLILSRSPSTNKWHFHRLPKGWEISIGPYRTRREAEIAALDAYRQEVVARHRAK